MKKVISLLLAAALLASLMPAVIGTASAAGTAYQLADLLNQGTIKPLGRTAVNPDGTGIMCDWPGNGFQMNVSGNGGTLEIVVSTNYAANWVVLCDDTQVYWERLAAAGGTISATIPAGDHLISVIKESDNQGKETDYCDLTTLTYDGTIAARPADKELVIEYIGDSYTAGWGTLGTYKPGRSWPATEHSFTHGYAYYMSENLNADYMIAARGGIGLFDGVSAEQPDDDPEATILDIYPYTAGFRKTAGLYDFDRQADIVIIELGANDSIKESDANFTAAKWKAALEEMTDMAREANPNAAIVFLSHTGQKLNIMRQVCEERAATDPNLYYFSFAHQGNGSGGSTQYYGHPNAEDSKRLADALSAYLEERGLTGAPAKAAEPTYTDIVYYASASGNDANDGKTLATAKKTLKGALQQAKADNQSFAADARIVVNVEGTVSINPSSSQGMATVDQLLLPDGKEVPILVQTNNYSGTKAILDTAHKSSDSNSCMVYFSNSMTLKDITFQATTHAEKGTRDYILFAGYNHIVFDNVTFAHAGDTPSTTGTKSWYINTSHVLSSVEIPADGESTITFKNGDYTNIVATTVYRANMVSPTVTNAASVHTRIIIEDGATMKDLYNRWGELGLGSSTVEIRGGTVKAYYGTVNSTGASYSNFKGDINFVMSGGTVEKFVGSYNGTDSTHKTFEGNINFTMTGGKITGTDFALVGNYADVTGNVNFTMTGGDIASNHFHLINQYSTVSGAVTNTVSGGIIEVRPTADYNTICFGGRKDCTLGSVTNNISGGQFRLIADATKSDGSKVISGIYLGGVSTCTIQGDVTNNITGGSFVSMNGKATSGYSALNFAIMSGKIGGTLYNNIIGGTFDMAATSNGGFLFGAYSSSTPIGRIVNVFGDKDSWQGPMFKGASLKLAGEAGAVGVTAKPTAMPAASECSDNVVISSTFYNGFCESTVYGGPVTAESSSKFNFVNGSIELNVYGGQLRSTVYSAGTTDVYGKVTTNLAGGHVGNVYAGGNDCTVYDGTELNISEGFQEYHDVLKTNSWHFWGGSCKANVPVPQTANRPSVKITVSAEDPANLILKTPIEARCANSKTIQGPIEVQVSGGTFPEGFAIGGTTVNAALAEGYVLVDTGTGTKLTYADTETTSGETSVTVIAEADVKEPVIPEEYIATVQNGQITTYATTVAEMTKAVASSGNSVITLYEDITYNGTITVPYSCTIDFNGHTVTTKQDSGNGITISAAGSKNKTTTVKNGTLLHFEIGVRVSEGAIIVENMTIRSNQGAPIGIYDPTDYKDINRVSNSFLSSALTGCIVFNKDGVDFSNTGITIENSVLVSHKKSGTSTASCFFKRSGAVAVGTVNLGKNVELYTYSSTYGTATMAGEALTKTTDESVQVGATTFTGMNKWSTPTSAAIVSETGKSYDSLSEAMQAIGQTGGTVRLMQDQTAASVTVYQGVTLDLNGKTVDATYFTCFGSVTDGSQGGEGLVKAEKQIHVAGQDSYLPIYDTAAGGYRFYKYELQNLGAKAVDGNPNAVKFGFRLALANTAGYDVLAATSDEALDTFTYLTWGSTKTPLVYQFKDATLKNYAQQAGADIAAGGATTKAIVLTVTGTDVLGSGTDLQAENAIVSAPGVTAQSASATWTTP